VQDESHVVWQVAGAAGGKKKGKKHADRKYGGLESARPDHGRRVSSTRYTSEPRKDNPRSGYTPMSAISNPRDSAAKAAEENADELRVPVVAEDDYLLPQSSAAPSAPPYMDVVADRDPGMRFCYCIVTV